MRPSKIVGVGWNYPSHLDETKASRPEEPIVFLKPPSSLIGDGETILVPEGLGQVDHEVELAVVIGERCRNVRPSEALSCVSGYAAFNDVTARAMQYGDRERGNPWAICKGIDTFSVMSEPVPADLDPSSLGLRLSVNGETRQHGRTSEMFFDVPTLIAYISGFMTLEPGDVIATGTPEGVGPIVPGDVVEIEIERVGTLRNPVGLSPRSAWSWRT